MQKLVERMGLEEDEAIEAGMLSRAIEGAQKKVEGKNFGIRKDVYKRQVYGRVLRNYRYVDRF